MPANQSEGGLIDEIIRGYVPPAAIVFDLDGTLWEGDVECLWGPPFECIDNKRIVSGGKRRYGGDLELFPESLSIVEWLVEQRAKSKIGFGLACASRTSEPKWSPVIMDLIKLPKSKKPLNKVWDISQIYPGEKQRHMRQIAAHFGCSLEDILFFDNEYRNITTTASIGVCAYYCPHGLSWKVLADALKKFVAKQSLSSVGELE